MQHPFRFTAGLTAFVLAAACADSPASPNAVVAPASGSEARQSASTTPEYDWSFSKKVLAIFDGDETNMILEPSTSGTIIVPGDVKWIEYELTATRAPAASYPVGTVITKDATARIDEDIVQACKNIFPSVICTWGGSRSPSFFSYTIDNSVVKEIVVDLHNFVVCGEEFTFTNHATLTELGPYPPGTSPQVRQASAPLVLKTGACPPKPKNPGCTLTQGYWKNHEWPAHPLFPGSTLENWEEKNGWSEFEWHFFDTKTEWKAILSVPPRGDVYYVLAHQYIAAILNQQKGAYVPEAVRAVLVNAYTYFSSTPRQRASVPRGTIIGWANVLDQYNNGKLGVPHCDDKNRGGEDSDDDSDSDSDGDSDTDS